MLNGVGVSFRILYPIVIYFYASFSGLITSVGEERDIFLLSFTCKGLYGFCSEELPLSLGAWDRRCYFNKGLPRPPI